MQVIRAFLHAVCIMLKSCHSLVFWKNRPLPHIFLPNKYFYRPNIMFQVSNWFPCRIPSLPRRTVGMSVCNSMHTGELFKISKQKSAVSSFLQQIVQIKGKIQYFDQNKTKRDDDIVRSHQETSMNDNVCCHMKAKKIKYYCSPTPFFHDFSQNSCMSFVLFCMLSVLC